MAKERTTYACSACGAQFPRWTGRCTECGRWSTVIEETKGEEHDARPAFGGARPSSVLQTKPGTVERFASLTPDTKTPRSTSGFEPLDRVLLGGFVQGSVTLISGEPGIGKSTLLAQAAMTLAGKGSDVLCVTGEESPSQVALRLKRISEKIPDSLSFLDATDAHTVAATIMDAKPALTIVDSIQSMVAQDVQGTAGSIAQTKTCAGIITEAAKRANVPVILAGQVNKEGDIAGPRLLEHLVDTVLMLEGDKGHRFRILRAMKHRFGATDEVAVLTMTEGGLAPVDDPSAELLRERPAHTSGSIVSCLMEGQRPILIELQALVTPAGYGTPVRRTTGIDTSRLGLLLAVLARRAGVKVLDKDVYANAAGGLKAREPAIDLGLCLAVASAVSDMAMDPKLVAFGEVGLGGEIRPVPTPDLRLKECARHGFKAVILPRGSKVKHDGIRTIEAHTVREAIDQSIGLQ